MKYLTDMYDKKGRCSQCGTVKKLSEIHKEKYKGRYICNKCFNKKVADHFRKSN